MYTSCANAKEFSKARTEEVKLDSSVAWKLMLIVDPSRTEDLDTRLPRTSFSTCMAVKMIDAASGLLNVYDLSLFAVPNE